MAAQTWRNKYGQAIRHAYISDGGGAPLRYIAKGREPYPLVGWQRVRLDNGTELYRHPDGTEFDDLQHAYDYGVASKQSAATDDRKIALTALQRFLNEAEAETVEVSGDSGERRSVTTTPVDDWLHRGDHLVLKPMP